MNENFKLDMTKRPRRLRKSSSILSLVQETRVSVSDLILPVFLVDGKKTSLEISSMPNVYRRSIDSLIKHCEKVLKQGITAIAPFPSISSDLKDLSAKESYNPNSLANRTIREVKKRFPELVIFADIALDPYTTHGHDGLLDKSGKHLLNDETVEILCKMSLSAAEAGADFVAPSDMMDGRIGAIRKTLDKNGFSDTGILAYSAKFASAFYGPFRDAVGSASLKKAPLDKRAYQLNPANLKEALKECALDEAEGADILMVKPAGAYLDVISKVKECSNLPLAAYQVSGEYSMIHAAAQNGWLNLEAAKHESLIAIKRAGADMILTYFADQL